MSTQKNSDFMRDCGTDNLASALQIALGMIDAERERNEELLKTLRKNKKQDIVECLGKYDVSDILYAHNILISVWAKKVSQLNIELEALRGKDSESED